MSTTASGNAKIARDFFEEIFNRKNLSGVDKFASPDVRYFDTFNGESKGIDGMKKALQVFLTGAPDVHMTVDQSIESGDDVVTRETYTGTNTGSVGGMPATGKKFNVRGVTIVKIVNGKAVDVYHLGEDLSFMQQIGIIPKMGQ